MKKIFLVFAVLFFISTPLVAFAESPLSLPNDAKEGAKRLNQQGISHYEQGHFDAALEQYEASERVQRVDKMISGETYFNEALAYDKLGKHGKATIHFKEAKILSNGNSKIMNSETLKKHIKRH
jgi:tetratricopeptide (TPR) repeat protein